MPSGRDTFVRTGLPLIGLVVGGWLGISWILEGRFEIKVWDRTAGNVLLYNPRNKATRSNPRRVRKKRG